MRRIDRDLIEAVSNGDENKIVRLLKKGADPNVQDSDGWSSLFFAMLGTRPSVIDLLTQAGANESLKDSSGLMPADYRAI